MNERTARRHVRRAAAEWARRMAVDPGVIGDPDARTRVVEAFGWLADYLAPAESSVLPANLRPLVTPAGTPPGGAPVEWSARDDDPDRREDPLPA